MHAGSGYASHTPGLYRACRREALAAATAERDRVLERLWAAGATSSEIATHFGWPLNQVGPVVARARVRGADLPRRRAVAA
jgi:DNA-directed RNA polymerase specialized sigma24 family protein